jgi:exosortase
MNESISFIPHPDYLIDTRLNLLYRQLMACFQELKAIKNLWVTLPSEVDRWWSARIPEGALSNAKIGVSGGARSSLVRRHLFFLLFAVASSLLFWSPLRCLVQFALAHDFDSHVILVVPISAYFIYRKRDEIVSNVRWGTSAGVSLFVAGAILGLLATLNPRFNIGDAYLWVSVLALVVLWISGFVFCYGLPAFQAARFPLLFLLLLIPIPDFFIGRVIALLQEGSAFVAFWLFKTLQVPVMREGLVFHIPSLDLEVSKECSGIRSSLILLITILLLAELVLTSVWRKSVLVLCVIPIVILKNGLRIVTISLLTVYVSRSFLHGWLHQSGGIVFYLLGLLVLLSGINWLKKNEIRGLEDSMGPVPSLDGTSQGRRTV